MVSVSAVVDELVEQLANPAVNGCASQPGIGVPFALKLTDPPVGTAPLALTLAVNVTGSFFTLGFKEEETTVEVERLIVDCDTVTGCDEVACAE